MLTPAAALSAEFFSILTALLCRENTARYVARYVRLFMTAFNLRDATSKTCNRR